MEKFTSQEKKFDEVSVPFSSEEDRYYLTIIFPFYLSTFQFLFPPKRIVTERAIPYQELTKFQFLFPPKRIVTLWKTKGGVHGICLNVSVPFSSEEDRYHVTGKNIVPGGKVSVPFSSEEDRYSSEYDLPGH